MILESKTDVNRDFVYRMCPYMVMLITVQILYKEGPTTRYEFYRERDIDVLVLLGKYQLKV